MDKVEMGRASRKSGKAFEIRVRKFLESEGWIVCHFSKKIVDGVLVDCRPKFNPFTKRIMSIQTGFPDFLCLRRGRDQWYLKLVESKLRGYLDGAEREQVKYLKELGFLDITVAYKDGDEIRFKQALANT